MSLFSPDKLLASFGFDPKAIMTEVEGFRAGMQQTILHFDARLQTILANQARIEAKLDALLSSSVNSSLSLSANGKAPTDGFINEYD